MEKFEFYLNADSVKYVPPSPQYAVNLAASTGYSKDVPVYVHIDNDLDYPAIITSGAGVVVAFFVALFTVQSSRNQIQANISNLRHAWMVELRDCSSELLQRMHSAAVHLGARPEFFGSEKYISDMERISLLASRVRLLLSREDASVEKIFGSLRTIVNALSDYSPDTGSDPILNDMGQFADFLRDELENAWVDIKRDLKHKSKKRRSKIGFRRMIQGLFAR